ncbi:MAG: SDR family oxidoreductase, partial [Pseudomonadota bacterium]
IAEPADPVGQFIRLDLDDADSIATAADAVTEPLDGLFNNAGLPPRDGLEAKLLRVNFLAQRTFTKALLPRLRAGASVVNMASKAGYGWREALDQIKRLAMLSDRESVERFVAAEALSATQAYNLSKAAVIAWTLAEAEPMIGRQLRMNSISPGGIATGILDDFAKAFGERMARNVERAGRPGNPEEVAAVAVFLLSPESFWIKGVDIPIDGGMGSFAVCDALELSGLTLPG